MVGVLSSCNILLVSVEREASRLRTKGMGGASERDVYTISLDALLRPDRLA